MDKLNDSKGTPTKRTGSKNSIDLEYEYSTEYGDIPDIDKPGNNFDDSEESEDSY